MSRTPTERLVLWIAVLASFVAFLDGTVVNVALPAIVDELGGGITTQQWTVDAYLLTLGSFILVAGSVSDSFGRRRVLIAGLIGFGIASVAIAAAPSAGFLIAARLVQGIAGAMLVPSSLALITSTFTGAAIGRAIGTWTAATSGAMIAGPILGGLAVDLASWRWAFLINVLPIGITLWLLTRLDTRDERDPDANVDLFSAALCAVGLGGMVFALIEQPNVGWGDPMVWGPGIGGVLLFALFLRRQARIARPMLPLTLFEARNFAWGNLATWFIYGALALSGFVIAIYVQEQAGLSATAAGLTMLPITVALILLSSKAGALSARLGPRLFMTAGPLLMAGGTLLMLMVSEDFNFWTQLLPGILIFGVGLAATVSPLTAAILGAVDPRRSGIASAVNNAVSRIAGLVTVAAVGAIAGGALDLAGFHRSMIAVAIALALGGLVSWLGIRNPATPADAPSAASAEGTPRA